MTLSPIDGPKLILLAVVAALTLLGAWVGLDRWTAAATAVRGAFRRSPWPGCAVIVLVAVPLLVAVAEDVLDREDGELVLQLDRSVRDAARTAGGLVAVRRAAQWVSWLTGPGLLLAVLVVSAVLGAARRWRDAAVLLGGTGSAWLLSAALKTVFAIARPRAHHTFYEISRYGFPSAHVLVTIVAGGLLVWVLARGAARGTRLGLYAAAGLAAASSGLSRIVLDAHWLSDVVAGLAAGLVWLSVIIVTASWHARPTPATLAPASAPPP